MADVDTSIYSKFAATPVNPLDTASKAIGLGMAGQQLQQGQLNTQLLGQQVQSKIALGRAVTAATDPKTGETDWNKAQSLLAQDPKGSFAVPELAGQVLDRKLKDLQNQGADLKLSGDRWAKVGDLAGSLLASKDPLTRAAVIKSVSENLIDSGMFHDEHSVGTLVNFVKNLPDDDAGLRKALQGVALQSNMTQERIGAILGNVQATDTGPGVTLTQTSPLGGGPKVRGVIDKALSPSEENTPAYTYKDDQNVEHIVTKKEAAAAGAGQAPAGIKSGLPIGSEDTAHANVAQAQALQQRAAIVPQRKAALSNMMNTLDSFQPGPKADLTYQLGALAQQFGKAAPSVTKGVAAQEEFNKLAAQIALDQWGTLGGTGSNEQLATTMKANPHETLSKMGIKNVAALLQGNEDAIGAQFDAWKKFSGVHGPASYGDFVQGWNRYYDPRVFQAEHMTPGAVKEMQSKMKPEELKTFRRNQAVAKAAGWIGGGQ